MIVLGIHFGHDSSASLIVDGQLVGCVEEERLVRIKQVRKFPTEAIRFLLDKAAVQPGQVDAVAVAGVLMPVELPVHALKTRTGKGGKGNDLAFRALMLGAGLTGWGVFRNALFNEGKFGRILMRAISECGLDPDKVSFHEHHACHGASAYYCSPFDDAWVFTLDGKGDLSSGGVFRGKGNTLETVRLIDHVHSIGQMYAAVTQYLGYRPNRHEGKITGLAAFAEPPTELLDAVEGLVDIRPDGDIVRSDFGGGAVSPFSVSNENLKETLVVLANHPRNLPYEKAYLQFLKFLERHAATASPEQVASTIQTACERWIVRWIDAVLKHEGVKKTDICLAGGIFANVKINQRIRDQVDAVDNLFVQPAMGDDGESLGAALLRHAAEEGATRVAPMRTVYYGPEFGRDAILQALEKARAAGGVTFEEASDVEAEIGRMLHEGKVIGRFNGGLEWGPRALGNRSILIRPTDKSINDTMNKRLNRTEFMPFAPSVLDYRAKDYFVGYDDRHIAAEFMTITYDVFPEKIAEIEAVVHVDGTARPQVVREDTNASYHKILREYERHSGIGCVVNTSFNIHEEPIVATPEDALRALRMGSVDVLAIGGFLVENA